VARPAGEDEWLEFALDVVPAYVASEGAVIWPEVEARLGELSWITDNHDASFPATWGIQPHVLHRARGLLVADGTLVAEPALLRGRTVTAYLDGPGLAGRSGTTIRRTAASKRRLYRSFLGWTGNATLCGHVAERVVDATLGALVGRYVWLPEGMAPGGARELLGRPITVGGPLDAHAFVPLTATDPTRGFIPVAVEVKNLRSIIYSWSHETWDLLAKLGDFPDVVPVLLARRLHLTTFRLFKDIGALGCATYRQWFHSPGTTRATIDSTTFDRARGTFGFHDAVLLEDPSQPQAVVRTFFTNTVRKEVGGELLIARQADRWRRAAPIVSGFVELRDEGLVGDDRVALMREFAAEIEDAGLLDEGGW
jgi:hypothetical protein